MTAGSSARLGCVVIGRNEGERLRRCLESLSQSARPVVYVDSGSTDQSVATARGFGATVVALDMLTPFTAARARNAGYRALREQHPDLDFVQFVDGDCVVVANWLETASAYLSDAPTAAVACGRRREVRPEASIYNRFCDIEWDTPIGSSRWCGGDAMMRCTAFDRVGGYNPTLVAGEEPELCVRLRAEGFSIERLPAEMTLHDAAMTRFSQWWKRTVRAGYAYAEGVSLHGRPPERHFVRELRRSLFWGAGVPIVTGLGLFPGFRFTLLAPLAYGVTAARSYRWGRQLGNPVRTSVALAAFNTIGRFAEVQGAAQYWWRRALRRPGTLIEYK